MDTLDRSFCIFFFFFFSWETTFATTSLLLTLQVLFKKGFTLKGMHLLPGEQITSFLRRPLL